MAHIFTQIPIHAVFSTSDRAPLLTDATRPHMLAHIGAILPNALTATADE